VHERLSWGMIFEHSNTHTMYNKHKEL